jgi:protein-S-isoprenylcysteine O-methyltransferase
LRWWAIYSLGNYFKVVVNLQPGQKLIKDGPYKYIRHPSYTGSLMVFIGAGIGFGNLIGLIVMIVLPLITFLTRAIMEEKTLVSFFGEDYLAYMRLTSRFVPSVHISRNHKRKLIA